jgi:hypothetical protein
MSNRQVLLAVLAVCIAQSSLAGPTGTGFTYQGQLAKEGRAADDVCDFRFGLWDAGTDGNEVAAPVDALNVAVSEGVFSAVLDFGADAFDGTARWLEIEVRCPAGSGAFTLLTPRQALTATPYSLFSLNVSSAALSDLDGDAVPNAGDNCPFTANAGQADGDGDGPGDVCDNCPDLFNPWNIDTDRDGTGDDCDVADPVCDPVAQTGCDPGEKCTFIPDEVNPDEFHTFCGPDGTGQLGGACANDPVSGLDDCVAGLFCLNGICQEICSSAPDSCPSGYSCTEFVNPVLVDAPGTGFCLVECNPLAEPTGCGEGEACYIRLDQQSTTCEAPFTSATQGAACAFINACASGYGCLLPNSPVNPTGSECAFICDAAGGGGPACAEGSEPSYVCVQLNRFYPQYADLPDAYGMCVDPGEWDEDVDGVLDYADECPDTPPATPVDAVGCPL